MEQQTHFRIRSLPASSDYNCFCDDEDVPMILDKVTLCWDKLRRLLLQRANSVRHIRTNWRTSVVPLWSYSCYIIHVSSWADLLRTVKLPPILRYLRIFCCCWWSREIRFSTVYRAGYTKLENKIAKIKISFQLNFIMWEYAEHVWSVKYFKWHRKLSWFVYSVQLNLKLK